MTRTEAGDTLRRKLLYPNLSMLDVSNNNLTSIPPDVNEVSQLTELKLNNNKLKEVSRRGRSFSFQRLFILLRKNQCIFAGSLESAYSSSWGSHEIWGQDLRTFMISRPI